jgi:hypothetical protein
MQSQSQNQCINNDEEECGIYIITSRKCDSNETILHAYSRNRESARLKMEEFALESLKDELKVLIYSF